LDLGQCGHRRITPLDKVVIIKSNTSEPGNAGYKSCLSWKLKFRSIERDSATTVNLDEILFYGIALLLYIHFEVCAVPLLYVQVERELEIKIELHMH
jgi:hypothetical protein